MNQIPFVTAVAEWVWGTDGAAEATADDAHGVSPERCLQSLPLMNGGCWSRLVSKVLGVTIILGACLNQIPVMLNLYNSKSAAGLSKTFLYGDLLIKANAAFYGYLAGIPLTAYGENIALTIQSIVVLLLSWHFAKVSLREKTIAVVAAAAYMVGVTQALPADYRYLLLASIWPLLVYSRGAQILETYRVKHTGAHSIITTGTNLLGGLARVGTTVVEVGFDLAMLTGLVLSVGLNAIATIQYVIYRRNTEKLYRRVQDKKKKKA